MKHARLAIHDAELKTQDTGARTQDFGRGTKDAKDQTQGASDKTTDPGTGSDGEPMMKRKWTRSRSAGFTLLEVMVSLVVGMMIVGGVMGSISMSIQYSHRVQKRLYESAVIEAAAEHLLTRPRDIEAGSITLDDFPGSPRVEVQAILVDLGDRQAGQDRQGNLYRVLLSYAKQHVEFSVIIPPEREGKL